MGHIKLWDTILDCPKVHDLSDLAFRVWIKTLVTALRNGGRNGELPSMKVLAFRLRMKPAEIESALEELHQSGLIDPCPDNHIGGIPWKVHDWDEWQTPKDRTAAARQAKWRERQALRNAQRNGVGNASHNAQEGMKEEDIPPSPPSRGKRSKKSAPKFDPKGFDPPEWIPREPWDKWVQYRLDNQSRKGKVTLHVLELAVKALAKLKRDGDEPQDVLEAAVLRTWSGLFSPRGDRTPTGARPPTPKPEAKQTYFSAADHYKRIRETEVQ